MKFLHCADLHLGCDMNGAKERFFDYGAAFSRIVSRAIAERADALILAGDLFHQRSIDPRTLMLATKELARLKEANIAVFACEGNHDKALYRKEQSWLSYLNDAGYLSLLSPVYENAQPHLVPYDGKTGSVAYCCGVRIVGFGFLGSTAKNRLASLCEELEPYEGYTVGLLHAGVDRLLGLDMGAIRSMDLVGFSGLVDYFALGHVHTRYECGTCFNPGAPENVHITESRHGQKGYYVVETPAQGKAAAVTFVPYPHRPVCDQSLNVTGLDEPAILSAAESLFLSAEPGSMYLLALTGTRTSERPIDAEPIRERLRACNAPLLVEIQDRTAAKGADGQSAAKTIPEIENSVMRALALEQGLPECAGGFALQLCESLLAQSPPDQLYALVESFCEQLDAAGAGGSL